MRETISKAFETTSKASKSNSEAFETTSHHSETASWGGETTSQASDTTSHQPDTPSQASEPTYRAPVARLSEACTRPGGACHPKRGRGTTAHDQPIKFLSAGLPKRAANAPRMDRRDNPPTALTPPAPWQTGDGGSLDLAFGERPPPGL